MTLIFALIIAAGLTTITMLGCVFFVADKIQKAAVRPTFLLRRQLAWQFA
ncbi:MAG: hypothetical protein NZ730_10570 [Porticoccaceae bacterium]|nr:hypothetical protein [Porticoccaceae bacterium]